MFSVSNNLILFCINCIILFHDTEVSKQYVRMTYVNIYFKWNIKYLKNVCTNVFNNVIYNLIKIIIFNTLSNTSKWMFYFCLSNNIFMLLSFIFCLCTHKIVKKYIIVYYQNFKINSIPQRNSNTSYSEWFVNFKNEVFNMLIILLLSLFEILCNTFSY